MRVLSFVCLECQCVCVGAVCVCVCVWYVLCGLGLMPWGNSCLYSMLMAAINSPTTDEC